MSYNLQFSSAKNYFLGFATSAAILFSGLMYFNNKEPSSSTPDFTAEENIVSEKIPLKEFNPNLLTEKDWYNLGFTEKQVATILKYRQVVGGKFISKAQLKKCYAISAQKYEELDSYILLPETASNHYKSYSPGGYNNYRSYSGNYQNFKKKELHIPGKFNPDLFSATDFVKMGFSENQANSILKYKNYLGGSFLSKEKFKACFMISNDQYRKMEPYLLLPEKTPESTADTSSYKYTAAKAKPTYQNFDPNQTDFEGWKKLGFSDKQAQVIINYRDRNLKGNFKNIDELASCFVISHEKMEELRPYIIINPEKFNTISPKKTETDYSSEPKVRIPENKTDFANVDLNKITFRQLTEFGFDEKSAAMMLSFRKKLGGFANTQQILDTYDIDKEIAQKLVSVSKLDKSNVIKYRLSDAPEEWLRNHPYFKYSADKIIYIRATETSDKKIWNFLKLKPEYETRMKLYLAQE